MNGITAKNERVGPVSLGRTTARQLAPAQDDGVVAAYRGVPGSGHDVCESAHVWNAVASARGVIEQIFRFARRDHEGYSKKLQVLQHQTSAFAVQSVLLAKRGQGRSRFHVVDTAFIL